MATGGSGGDGSPAQEIEVEWQFDALDLRPVERWLAGLPLRAAVEQQSTITAQAKPSRRLVDCYLDSADWRIGRAGFVLRTRRRGRHAEATLKDDKPAEASGLRQRLEVTEPLPAGDITKLSSDGPVGRRVRAMAGRRPLRQVVEVRTRRRPFSVRVGGEEVAELVLDETAVVVGSGERPVQLRRVEVEVSPAWADWLAPLVDELRHSCGLQPATFSKYEAGLLAIGATIPGPTDLGPTAAGPTSTMGELALAILRRHLGVVLAHEPGTRLGEDIEELHDIRVGTRRLRAAIDLFADVLPVRATALSGELKWLAGVLGVVRDLDVQLERMDDMEQLAASWSERATGSPLAEVRALLERHRHDQRDRLLEALDSPRWERLAAALTTMVGRAPLRTVSARQPAVLAVPALVEERHQRVVKASRRARRSGEAADYHRLRIRAKRLRYSLEFTADLYGARTERFTKRLARLQDRLGLLQDAEVATTHLFELATSADEPLSSATVFAMGGVAEWYRAGAGSLLAELPGALKVVVGKEWRELEELMERRRAEVQAALPATAPRAGRATPPPVVGTTTEPTGSPADGEAAPRTAGREPEPEPEPPAVDAAKDAAADPDVWPAATNGLASAAAGAPPDPTRPDQGVPAADADGRGHPQPLADQPEAATGTGT